MTFVKHEIIFLTGPEIRCSVWGRSDTKGKNRMDKVEKIVIGFLVVVLVAVIMGAILAPAIKTHTDENGCQYLRTVQGGITPRLNSDGNQMGCGK